MFSGCGYHVPALAYRARGVPSRPRHVQRLQRKTSTCSTLEAKRSRAYEEAGQMERVRGVPRRSEPHSPSATPAPDVVGCSTGGLCQDEQSPAQKTGEPPENLKGADPRNGGRRPQNRTGANPRTGFSGSLRGIFAQRPAPQVVGGRSSPTACRRWMVRILHQRCCTLSLNSSVRSPLRSKQSPVSKLRETYSHIRESCPIDISFHCSGSLPSLLI